MSSLGFLLQRSQGSRTLYNTADANLDCVFVKGTPVFIDPKSGGLNPLAPPPPVRPPESSTTILVNHLTYNLANENQLDGNKATGIFDLTLASSGPFGPFLARSGSQR